MSLKERKTFDSYNEDASWIVETLAGNIKHW